MKLEGDAAKTYDAVRRDSCVTVNKGILTFADTDTGEVKWKDSVGEEVVAKLEPYNLLLQPRNRYHRGSD